MCGCENTQTFKSYFRLGLGKILKSDNGMMLRSLSDRKRLFDSARCFTTYCFCWGGAVCYSLWFTLFALFTHTHCSPFCFAFTSTPTWREIIKHPQNLPPLHFCRLWVNRLVCNEVEWRSHECLRELQFSAVPRFHWQTNLSTNFWVCRPSVCPTSSLY